MSSHNPRREAANKGAQLLDKVSPGWAHEIRDTGSIFNIRSTRHCPIGILCPAASGYDEHARYLFAQAGFDSGENRVDMLYFEYGFDLRVGSSEDWDELQSAWVDEISSRIGDRFNANGDYFGVA